MDTDLLCLCTIDKWIEKWRDQQVNARNENMDKSGDVRTKPMCKEREEGKEVELEEDTDVSDASIECFQPSLLLGQMKNCDKYLYIGQCDAYEVKHCNSESHKQTIDFVDPDIFCSQLYNGHMLIVAVGDNFCMIKVQLAFYQY